MKANAEVRNTCTSCGHTWLDRPGLLARIDECPKCGSKYWDANELKQLEDDN